jgi:uncharacterized membrane protein YhaH (DUF805 family)
MKRLLFLAAIDSEPHSSPERPPSVQGAIKKKNPLTYFAGAFKKYAVFTGRARRAEVWYFVLFNFIITIAAFIALIPVSEEGDSVTVLNIVMPVYMVYLYMLCIPSLALFVRRIHDAGKSGWFALVPVYNIVLLFIPGTGGPNRFGPDPKQTQPEAPVKVLPGMMVLRILSILAPVWYVGCCLAALVIAGEEAGGWTDNMFWIYGLLILFFAVAHGTIAFLQGIKYQCAPVKISALVDFVLLGLSIVLYVLALIISKVDNFSLWLNNLSWLDNFASALQPDAAYDLGMNVAIGIGIFVGVTLFYIIAVAVATEIWSFREKKTE